MKLRKSKKTVRVLSLILAVAMLMSAMMVQAFAASDSEILQGYTAYAYCSRYTSNNTPFGEVTFDVAAGLDMNFTVYYDDKSDSTDDLLTYNATGSAYHYQLTVNGRAPGLYEYVKRVIGLAKVGYNGSECTLYPTAYF